MPGSQTLIVACHSATEITVLTSGCKRPDFCLDMTRRKRNIGIIVNISLIELTAHPIFCLQLAHHLSKVGDVTLYVPGNNENVNLDGLERRLGFPINFEIKSVRDRAFGRRSLRWFFYLALL